LKKRRQHQRYNKRGGRVSSKSFSGNAQRRIEMAASYLASLKALGIRQQSVSKDGISKQRSRQKRGVSGSSEIETAWAATWRVAAGKRVVINR